MISAFFGGAAGAIGTTISTLGSGWPTGPFIVIVASSFFAISLFFGKEKGVFIKYWQFKMHKQEVADQYLNTPFIKEKEVKE